jgi:hypothetical protein
MLRIFFSGILSDANVGHDIQKKSDDNANEATIIFSERVESQKKENITILFKLLNEVFWNKYFKYLFNRLKKVSSLVK